MYNYSDNLIAKYGRGSPDTDPIWWNNSLDDIVHASPDDRLINLHQLSQKLSTIAHPAASVIQHYMKSLGKHAEPFKDGHDKIDYDLPLKRIHITPEVQLHFGVKQLEDGRIVPHGRLELRDKLNQPTLFSAPKLMLPIPMSADSVHNFADMADDPKHAAVIHRWANRLFGE